MSSPAYRIPVPKPSRKAYNPHRLLSRNLLIKSQVEHFLEAEKHLPPDLRTGIDPASIATEGQASAYIRKVTEAIHKSGGTEKVKKAP